MVQSVKVDHFALGEKRAGVAFTRLQFPDLAGPSLSPSVEKFGFLGGRVVPDAKKPGPVLDDGVGGKGFWGCVVG